MDIFNQVILLLMYFGIGCLGLLIISVLFLFWLIIKETYFGDINNNSRRK